MIGTFCIIFGCTFCPINMASVLLIDKFIFNVLEFEMNQLTFCVGATSPSFGANNVAVPQFGATGTPQFGAASPAPGTFNIGAGPPASNRGRTTLKPRRRI
ncbi:unnamed protein product [Acanthoscelides obtectus]|uniref:Uncharacterized protein n=1 Tax=Acanthoscelides obtectus TaxID=200917 RepID=A0A9P0PSA5_ACAOB|nr:unnamed protein product [Acanthoscelides obtectus]CAK1653654.1 hypothetical protein AOBTE_LOCUS18314 [Acanthoscelides obtectus]